MGAETPAARALGATIRGLIGARLGHPANAVPTDVRFRDLGIDSSAALGILAELGEELGRSLSPTVWWTHSTVDALAAHLSGQSSDVTVRAAHARGLTPAEPIAIVGIGCRLPASIDGPDALWRALRDRVNGICEVPADRWDAGAWFDPDPGTPGRMSTRWGGFIDDVDRFDAAFFRITPIEARQMDPHQRIVLEVAWHALEDAGIVPDALADHPVGVYMGAMWQGQYTRATDAGPGSIRQHSATGRDSSIISARVAYALGLRGPALTVNTACSSSAMAVHLAARAIVDGDCEIALAGGVNLMLAPDATIEMSKFGAMNPDGQCRAFDAGANGYVRGEGAAVLVLMPLSRALARGCRPYGVLRGSAANNDGGSNGLTAPDVRAQADVLAAAWSRAGIAPGEVDYVETHGPGTILGDPIEASALGMVFGAERDVPLSIGSIKSNIGHLEAAAGVAGLAKVALTLQRGALPANLHFDAPNPHIDFDELDLHVVGERMPLGGEGERRAGVSSFGFGGTNVHLALTEAPGRPSRVVALAAESADALRARAGAVASRVAELHDDAALDDVCGRVHGHGPVRATVRRRSLVAMRAALQAFAIDGGPTSEVDSGAIPGVVLVFGGSGGQWTGMARDLLGRTPAFGRGLARCDAALAAYLGWSVRAELAAGTLPDETERIQPILFAVQVALARTLMAWGVQPRAVVGQSLGEVAAAVIAGALTLADGARVIVSRSRLVTALADGAGGLAIVDLDAPEASALPDLELAGELAPSRCIVAGSTAALDALARSPRAADIGFRRIAAAYASHSSAMDPVAAQLVDALAGPRGRTPDVPWFSTARGAWITEPVGADYWGDNLRQPVRLRPAIERLADGAPVVFVEVGPHPVLRGSIRATLDAAGRHDAVWGTCWRDEAAGDGLRELVGELWCRGVPVHWGRVAGRSVSAEVPVPLPISAHTPAALSAQADRWSAWIESHRDVPWQDVVATAACHRTHFTHRAAIHAADGSAAAVALRALAEGRGHPAIQRADAGKAPQTAFVFQGQGGQWVGMGPAIARAVAGFPALVERCDAVFEELLGRRIGDVLLGAESARALERVDEIQPALFVMALGLVKAWQARGILPDVVIGHSQGEVPAAVVAGALTVEQGATIVARRSRLLRELSGSGGMAVVRTPLDELRGWLPDVDPRLWLAVVDGPEAGVVAGPPDAVAALEQTLAARDVFCRRVDVDYASHGPGVDPVLDDLRAALADLRPGAVRVPMRSTVTGDAVDGTELDADYWCSNLRAPVRLDRALERMLERETVFVEIGPHPLLAHGLGEWPGCRAAVPSMRRDVDVGESLARGVGQLYVSGGAVDWARALDGGAHPPMRLPGYAFERTRHWMDQPSQRTAPPAVAREDDMAPTEEKGGVSEAVLADVSAAVAAVTGLDPQGLDVEAGLMNIGIDSLMFMQIRNAIRARFSVEVPNALFFDPDTSTRTVADFVGARQPAPKPRSSAPTPSDRGGPTLPTAVDGVSMDGVARLMAEQVRAMSELARQQLEALQRLGGLPASAPRPSAPRPQRVRPLSTQARAAEQPSSAPVFRPYRPIQRQAEGAADHMGELVDAFCGATPTSKARTQADRFVFANNRNIAGFTPTTKEMTYQIIADRAQGGHVWDLDGRRYVDLTQGFGSSLLGHGHPLLTEAIRRQLDRTWAVGPISNDAATVARHICAMTGAERVAFYNSGTEAVMVSIRLARTATARPKVVFFEGAYHGMFDGLMAIPRGGGDPGAAAPMAPGVPASMVADTLVLRYDDPTSLRIIEERGSEIAGVLVESVQSRRPDRQPRAFLHQLRALTTRIGAALIFDEVVTGFRTGPGGAQAWFGVQADIAAYGKVAGGAMPVGIVAGRAAFLDGVDGGMWRFGDDSTPDETNTFVAGTFCSHPLTMASARAMLEHLTEEGPSLQRELNARTRRLCTRLNQVFAETGLPIHTVPFGSLFRYVVPRGYDLLYNRLLIEGVYVWEGRNCFLATAHTDDDIDHVIAATRASAEWLATHVAPGAPTPPTGRGVEHLPASATQQMMHRRGRRPGSEQAYHVPAAMIVEGPLDIGRFEPALTELTARHESLRTSFHLDGETPWRRVHPFGDFELTVSTDLSADAIDDFIDSVIRPFDVTSPIMLRVGVARLGPQEHLVVLDAHHLAVDGVSLRVVIDELLALAQNRVLDDIRVHYRDYVRWHRGYLESPRLERHESAWRALLSDLPPRVELPRSEENVARLHSYRCARVWSELTGPEALRALARSRGVTLSMLLHGVFQAWLGLLSGCRDLFYGSPTAGRPDGGFDETVGQFIGTAVYRSTLAADLRFVDVLERARDATRQVLELQHVPFEALMGLLADAGDGSTPFEVGFNYEADMGPFTTGALRVTPRETPLPGMSLGCVVEVHDRGETLRLCIAHDPERYHLERVEQWAQIFDAIARRVVADPESTIDAIRADLADDGPLTESA